MAAKVFCVEGNDSFRIKKSVNNIKQKYIDPANEVMNYDQIEDSDIDKAINSVSMIPFFGNNRLVHLVNPVYLRPVKSKFTDEDLITLEPDIADDLDEYFSIEKNNVVKLRDNKLLQLQAAYPEIAELFQGDQASVDRLIAAMKNADENVIVLISSNQGNLDKRKKTVKEIKKLSSGWETFEKLTSTSRDFNLTKWLQDTAAEFDCKFDNAALQMLNSIGGRDLDSFYNEIVKFSTYAGRDKVITLEDIKQLISYDELAEFEIANAVRTRNKKKLLAILYKTLKDDYGILMQTIGGIAYQIKAFLKVKLLYNSGIKNPYDISRQVGIHQYPVSMIIKDINRYSLTELKRIIIALHEMDHAIKIGKADSLLLLELTVSKYF